MAKVCWYCDCESMDLDDDSLCGNCIELIIPKSMQDEFDENEDNYLDEEE